MCVRECVCESVCECVCVCERVQPPDKDASYPWLDVASHLNKRAGPSVYHPSVCLSDHRSVCQHFSKKWANEENNAKVSLMSKYH